MRSFIRLEISTIVIVVLSFISGLLLLILGVHLGGLLYLASFTTTLPIQRVIMQSVFVIILLLGSFFFLFMSPLVARDEIRAAKKKLALSKNEPDGVLSDVDVPEPFKWEQPNTT